jgi:hypothetical protein
VVEVNPDILLSTVFVSGAGGSNFGLQLECGISTTTHTLRRKSDNSFEPVQIGSGPDMQVIPPERFRQNPFHDDLTIIDARVVNAKTLPMNRLKALGEAEKMHMAIVTFKKNTKGLVEKGFDPRGPSLRIYAGTEDGMCGAAYAARNAVYGQHGYGNNDNTTNGGHRYTPEMLAWFRSLPKN